MEANDKFKLQHYYVILASDAMADKFSDIKLRAGGFIKCFKWTVYITKRQVQIVKKFKKQSKNTTKKTAK